MPSRHTYETLTDVVASCVKENRGVECLLLAVEALKDAASQICSDQQANTDAQSSGTGVEQPGLPLQQQQQQLGRKLIWFHHIKSTTKRKHIVAWARELGIRGFSKPGFPGIIICEGLQGDVQEYYSRVRGMRWQVISVRAEEIDEGVEPEIKPWHFQERFQELGEGDMDVLAAECQKANLEHFFMAALKL